VRFFWMSAVKDLNRMRKDPGGLILSAAIPLVIAFLLRLAFGSGGSGAQITAQLLVVDHDDSVVSNLFRGALHQGPLADLISVTVLEEEEARARIDQGDASALLLIPDGFGDSVLRSRPVTLTLLTNPSQRILPAIVREALEMFTEAGFYAQQLLGAPLRDIASGVSGDAPPTDRDVAAVSMRVNQAVAGLAPYLFPPRLDLDVVAQDEEPGPDFGGLFLPGMLLMALMFVAQSRSDDVWEEREAGTLRRVMSSPGTLGAFVGGKVAASGVFMLLVGLVGLLAGKLVFGVAVEHLAVGAAWLGLTGVVLLLIMTLVQLFASTPRGGHVLTTVIVFPLIMLGGSFFPMEVMPDFLAAIGRLTPNGWSLEVLKHIIGVKPGPVALLPAAGFLAAMAGVLFSLCLLRLRRGFAVS